MRDMTDKEYNDVFGSNYKWGKDGKKKPPSFSASTTVWSTSFQNNDPIYNFYNCGTNCLIMAKYSPEKDIWKKVELCDIPHLGTLIWQLLSQYDFIKDKK